MKFAVKVAGIVIRVESDTAPEKFRDFAFYRDFIAAGDIRCHCLLDHTIGPPPEFACDAEPFRAGNWQLASCCGRNVLSVGPQPKRSRPDNVVVFNRDYSRGAMYQKRVTELFRRFIDQFLIINLLARNNGFLLHASGLIWKGKGICFAGPSGSGKSTLLNLFKDELEKEHLLNDDRLALRRSGRRWTLHGTPWYGESRVSSSNSARLSAIFFIRHARRNYVRPITRAEAFPRLMVLGLLPVWDRAATSRVLLTFQDLMLDVPAYELGFVPGKAAVGLIKKTLP